MHTCVLAAAVVMSEPEPGRVPERAPEFQSRAAAPPQPGWNSGATCFLPGIFPGTRVYSTTSTRVSMHSQATQVPRPLSREGAHASSAAASSSEQQDVNSCCGMPLLEDKNTLCTKPSNLKNQKQQQQSRSRYPGTVPGTVNY